MDILAHNLRFLRIKSGLSQSELAKAISVSRSNLAKYEQNIHDPGIKIILRISRYFQLSVDNLLQVCLNDENYSYSIKNQGFIFPVQVDPEGKDVIELVPHQAAAGYAGSYNDPDYIENLQHLYLPFIKQIKNCRAFPISGDSMPPVADGSYVIGARVAHSSSLKIGSRYIIVSRNEGIVFKRIIKQEDGHLYLQSDNPHYETYPMALQDVLEIWEYVASIDVQDSATTYEQNILVEKLENLQRELDEVKKYVVHRK